MRVLRLCLAACAVAVCIFAALRLTIPRLVCNRNKAIVNTEVVRFGRAAPSEYERVVRARQLEEMCRRCLERFPNDYEFHLLLASNEHLLGEDDAAERSYRRSLELNQRPETYAYLAQLQLERGKTEEARQNLYHAALFNIRFVLLVSPPLQTEVYEAVMRRHDALRSRKSNP